MALADFTPDTETIYINKKSSFDVRGLSVHDISKIIKVHYHDLDGLFDLYEKSAGQDFTAIATGRFAVTLISDAPGLVSHIIALAADEEAQLETVQKIPVMAQVEALKAIARLTFSDIEDVKKLVAQVMGQVGDLNQKTKQGQKRK